ncbi:MAG: hypothetical protein R3B47_20895 [Bacteroidia bacterium]
MSEKTYLTQEGMDRLRRNCALNLKPAAEKLPMLYKKAREMGDLSENAEYDAAKDARNYWN